MQGLHEFTQINISIEVQSLLFIRENYSLKHQWRTQNQWECAMLFCTFTFRNASATACLLSLQQPVSIHPLIHPLILSAFYKINSACTRMIKPGKFQGKENVLLISKYGKGRYMKNGKHLFFVDVRKTIWPYKYRKQSYM